MGNKDTVIVKKFGGTSVRTIDHIKAVAKRIIATKETHKNIIVVVSAMGDTTDTLVQLTKQIASLPDRREYDALLSTGETVSAALMAMTLIEMGHPAISLTGPQAGVITEKQHSKAKILDVKTKRIEKELAKGKIVIITGFQGINQSNDVTTIGRGGSDTSAVVLAASLESTECEIYTDVDGIYTTDPRKVKSAQKLKEVSYDEMLELASLGAKVLHPRSVECAKENNIILHVRSSFESTEGTRVKEVSPMEVNKPVTGITMSTDEIIISVLNIPDHPGSAGILFSTLGDQGVNVDMIIQNTEQDTTNNISFSIHQEDLETAIKVTTQVVQEIGAKQVIVKEDIAKISIVGVGMISKPGVAAKMFKTLGDAGINILRITTSEIKVSCAISQEDAQKALELLHHTFQLDQ
jgi:aspartate kinase